MPPTKDPIDRIISLALATMRLARQKSGIEPMKVLRTRTLFFIAERQNPTMREVADFLCVTPPSATSLIDTLVKERELKRTIDKKDRRIIRLSLTLKGKRTLHKGHKKMTARMRKFFSHLNTQERAQLIKILIKLQSIYET